uniref:F-box domain-containing protein n=1 Tax=Percolomonas cosmopolitus TaxID=63605 RepID=A0A7S1PGN9_9EUKA|mmetsp:Transcript_3543/g.13565  ORF Transcript_3543/g.13565 Transcript_3543/m.13565 type:complete len:1022 (+) Transcript_3543:727-3792(+)
MLTSSSDEIEESDHTSGNRCSGGKNERERQFERDHRLSSSLNRTHCTSPQLQNFALSEQPFTDAVSLSQHSKKNSEARSQITQSSTTQVHQSSPLLPESLHLHHEGNPSFRPSIPSSTKTVPLQALLHSRSQLQHEKTKELTAEQKAEIGATLRENENSAQRKKRKRKRANSNTHLKDNSSSSNETNNAIDIPVAEKRKSRRVNTNCASATSPEKSIATLLLEIPAEIWTVILLHVPPIGSYANLSLVNKHFYNSLRYNDHYWHHQCIQCLRLSKQASPDSCPVSSDGDSSNSDSNNIHGNTEKRKRQRPERSSNQDPTSDPSPTQVVIPSPHRENLSWYMTYTREHSRLLQPPSDGNWLNLANSLADQELFFYALHAYKKAQVQDPDDPFTTACIGDLFYKNYLHKSAFDHLQSAISNQGLAAEQAPWAYRQLSHLYRDALGAPSKDITKAITLLKSSIEQTNDVDAMYELGDLYDELRLKSVSGAKPSNILHDGSSDDTSSTDSNGSPSSGSGSAGSSSVKSVTSSNSGRNQSQMSESAPSMNSEQSDSSSGRNSMTGYNQESVGSSTSEPSPSTTFPPFGGDTKRSFVNALNFNGDNTSSSSDNQVYPKTRARLKDRFRSVPLHSARFSLRDDSTVSSDCTSSESPESEGQGRIRKDISSLDNKFFKMAVYWFEMAASYGDTESMFELANMYPDSSPQRAAWLQKAADMGHKDALNDLAVMYELGQGGLHKDLIKAFEYYQASSAAGSVDGMTNAGLMYEFGKGISRDYKKSIDMYMEAAKNGSARAMKNIGVMYELCRGVQRNYEKAVEWYQKAAEQNDTDAMLYLGTMAASGRGMPKSYRTALKWFRTVLNEHQDTVVYPYLAHMYIHGYGTRKDVDKGLKYLNISAFDHEDPTGQYMLGEVYHLGIDSHTKPDRKMAVELFERSAKQEDHDATLHLSYFYSHGIAVPKSEAKAQRIFDQIIEEIGIDRCLEMADDICAGSNFYAKDPEYATYIWSCLATRTKSRAAIQRLQEKRG